MSNQDLLIVIRQAGERTYSLCKRLIVAQGFSEEDIVSVTGNPFYETFKASIEVAIEVNKPWTLCVDADVLLATGSIKALLTSANRFPPTTFEYQGFMIDKFFGGYRSAGNHLYRTSCLKQMLDVIPRFEDSARPETEAINEMRKFGFGWIRVPLILGLHDYEQSPEDIFRKCQFHLAKHDQNRTFFREYWCSMAEVGFEFEIAQYVLNIDGSIITPKICDASNSSQFANTEMRKMGWNLVSKEPDICLSDIDDELRTFVPSKIYERFFPTWIGYKGWWDVVKEVAASAIRLDLEPLQARWIYLITILSRKNR